MGFFAVGSVIVLAAAFIGGLLATKLFVLNSERNLFVRLLPGAGGGAASYGAVSNSSAYSYIAGAASGDLGLAGYAFTASLILLALVWIGNLLGTRSSVVR